MSRFNVIIPVLYHCFSLLFGIHAWVAAHRLRVSPSGGRFEVDRKAGFHSNR